MPSIFDHYILYRQSKVIVEEFESVYDYSVLLKIEEFIEEDLSDLEKEIYNRYYFSNKSLKDVAKDMNFSYSHIQGTHMRLKSKMLIALKSSLTKLNDEEYKELASSLKELDN